MRDHLVLTRSVLAETCTSASVHRTNRKGTQMQSAEIRLTHALSAVRRMIDESRDDARTQVLREVLSTLEKITS